MAERRMFAKAIIDSDMFLDMPLSTQALYFHLAMRADDDGFVSNPKKIMRMIGAGEDGMKLLAAKQYIIPFESGIVVIKHWKIHNYIQKDRYKQTLHVEEKAMLSDSNSGYTLTSPADTQCIQDVYISDTQVRIGKDSIGKDSIGYNAQAREEADPVPYKKIMELYNDICKSYCKIRDINGKRKIEVAARYKANPDIEIFRQLFTKAETSRFLKGENDRHWKADFDFMIHAAKFDKILEGAYDNPKQEDAPSYDVHEIEQDSYDMYKDI